MPSTSAELNCRVFSSWVDVTRIWFGYWYIRNYKPKHHKIISWISKNVKVLNNSFFLLKKQISTMCVEQCMKLSINILYLDGKKESILTFIHYFFIFNSLHLFSKVKYRFLFVIQKRFNIPLYKRILMRIIINTW